MLVQITFQTTIFIFFMAFFLKMTLFAYHTHLLESLLKEAHARGLAGHFGRDKTLALLSSKLY